MESRDQLGGLLETMLRAAGRMEVPFFAASRGVCRIGWRTASGKEIPAQSLSGGEWILFAACLTAAVLILRNAPLRILLVEAGEADAPPLQALLDAIRSVRAQAADHARQIERVLSANDALLASLASHEQNIV